VTNRTRREVTYLSTEEQERLEEAAEKYGISKSEAIRQAVREFTDYDRSTRLEGKIDELQDQVEGLTRALENPGVHTHTSETESADGVVTDTSPTVKKLRQIARRVRDSGPNLEDAEIDRTIEDIAGGHPQTLEKYRERLKQRGHAYRHPSAPVWYTEQMQFFEVVASWAESQPEPERAIRQHLDPYGFGWEAFSEWLDGTEPQDNVVVSEDMKVQILND